MTTCSTLLAVAKAGIHPPDEMPFGVAWTIAPGRRVRSRASCSTTGDARGVSSPEDWTLNLMVESEGGPIGAQSVRAGRFAVFRTVDTGSWLGRGSRVAASARRCAPRSSGSPSTAWAPRRPRPSAFLDNARVERRVAGARLRGERASAAWHRRASPRVTQKFRMTAEGWRARPRPPLDDRGPATGSATCSGRSRASHRPDLEPAAGPAAATARRATAEPATTAAARRRGRVADRPERRHHPADVRDARVGEEAAAAADRHPSP